MFEFMMGFAVGFMIGYFGLDKVIAWVKAKLNPPAE